jgi:hypothetical protein
MNGPRSPAARFVRLLLIVVAMLVAFGVGWALRVLPMDP